MRRVVFAAFILLCGCSSTGTAGPSIVSADVVPATSRSCPSDEALAWKVATARIIIVGKIQAPISDIDAAGTPNTDAYIPVTVQVSHWLKGSGGEAAVTVQYYPDPSRGRTIVDQLGASDERSRLVFGVYGDETTAQLYLAGPDALVEADETVIDSIAAEVARQRVVVAGWQPHRYLPHYAEIKSLIDALAAIDPNDGNASKREQVLFDKIEALGPEAVPALIDLMDDRRPLAAHSMGLVNKAPDAFEGIRWYGPEQVVDAIAALLNQISGEHFGFIYNGATDAERDATVAGWRVYANDLSCRT